MREDVRPPDRRLHRLERLEVEGWRLRPGPLPGDVPPLERFRRDRPPYMRRGRGSYPETQVVSSDDCCREVRATETR